MLQKISKIWSLKETGPRTKKLFAQTISVKIFERKLKNPVELDIKNNTGVKSTNYKTFNKQ